MTPKNLLIYCIILLSLLSFSAVATVTHSGIVPANHLETTDTSIDFNWNLTSTLTDVLISYLYITETGNESSYILNATNTTCTNDTLCSHSVAGFSEGFYKWYVDSTDDNGTTNYTSAVRWLDVRGTYNVSNLIWQNDSDFVAMTLDKDTGDLWTAGNITSIFTWAVNTAYFGWNGTYLNWVFGDIYTQTEIEGMNTTLTSEDTLLNARADNLNTTKVDTGENISSNYITDTPAGCAANSAITQFGAISGNFSESTCADSWLNIGGDETITGAVNFAENINMSTSIIELDDDFNVTWSSGGVFSANATCVYAISPGGNRTELACD